MQRVNSCFYIGCGGDEDGAIDRESWHFGLAPDSSSFWTILERYFWLIGVGCRTSSATVIVVPSRLRLRLLNTMWAFVISFVVNFGAVAILWLDLYLPQFCVDWWWFQRVSHCCLKWSVQMAERGHISLRIRPFFSFLFSPCHVGWSILYPDDKEEVYKLKTSSCT